MKNKWAYLERLKLAIEQKYRCSCFYRRTQLVHEKAQGKTVWIGEVEVFELANHPKAKRCYAWDHGEGRETGGNRFVAMLDVRPVVSPQAAVRASLGVGARKRRKRRTK